MTFTLRKDFRFEASHQLMLHDGKCARLHGHSWTGHLTVSGWQLQADGPKKNMIVDFGQLGQIVDAIFERFDHRHLNDVLKNNMPTAELMAQTIFNMARDLLTQFGTNQTVVLDSVTVNETCTAGVTYRT